MLPVCTIHTYRSAYAAQHEDAAFLNFIPSDSDFLLQSYSLNISFLRETNKLKLMYFQVQNRTCCRGHLRVLPWIVNYVFLWEEKKTTKHLAQLCPLHSWSSMFVFLSPPEHFRGEISMLELISKPRTKSGMWQLTGCLSGEILLPLPQQPNQPTVTSSASLGHPHKPTVSPTSSAHFPPNSVIPVYRRDERRNTSHKMGLAASSSSSVVFPTWSVSVLSF